MENDHNADVVIFEEQYEKEEVQFFMGSSNQPLSLLHDETGKRDEHIKKEKRHLIRQQQIFDDHSLVSPREDVPLPLTVVTAASDPNIAEDTDGPVTKTPKRTPEEIMSTFNETEKSFREEFFSPEIISMVGEKAKTTTSLFAPTKDSNVGSQPINLNSLGGDGTSQAPSVGLNRLCNLIQLMELLSFLTAENKRLKKKCVFLDDTRSLLQVQNEMLLNKETSSALYQQKVRVMDYLSRPTPSDSKPRLTQRSRQRPSDQTRVNSESFEKGTVVECDDDKEYPNVKLHKRSQSVGSIEMVDLDLSSMAVQVEYRHKNGEKASKFQFSRASKTSKKFQAKWKKVKKVFSGKPEQLTRADSSAVSAEQLVKVNSRLKRPNKPPDLPHVKSETDFTAGREMDHLKPGNKQLSRSVSQLAEPPSPSSVQSEPPQPSDSFGYTEPLDEDPISPQCSTPSNREQLARSQSLSSMSSVENAEIGSTMSKSNSEDAGQDGSGFLTVQTRRRRKSSPTISMREQAELLKNLAIHGQGRSPERTCQLAADEETSTMKRSSSFKDTSPSKTDQDQERPSPIKNAGKETASKARAAWVKVKDIIHTRKDSLKSRNRRTMSAGDGLLEGYNRDLSPGSAHGSPSDSEVAYTRRTSPMGRTSPDSPHISRKTKAKTMPRRPRKSFPKAKSTSPSPPGQRKRQSLAHVAMSGATPDEIAALLGVSEDFTKKMAEWETKKKGELVKASSFSYEEMSVKPGGTETTKFTEDFIKKMEQWEQMKGLGTSPKQRDSFHMNDPTSCLDSKTQMGTSPPEESVVPKEPILSESFSKTVLEWERVKEKRAKETSSPTPVEVKKHRASRKDDRSKSRERDRSRHKYEKEMQKIEKKELQIERERQKLEKMKLRLDMTLESSSSSQESQGMSQGFMKKLHEWEVMKGFKQEQSEYSQNVEYQHSISQPAVQEPSFHGRERVFSDGALQALQNLEPPACSTGGHTPRTPRSSNRSSPGETRRSCEHLLADHDTFHPARVLVDDSTSVDMNLTTLSTSSLEERNADLICDLQRKEEDIATLQLEMQQLMDAVQSMKQQHQNEIDDYRRELWATSKLGKYTIESDLMAACLHDLNSQIKQLQQHGERLSTEKENLESRQVEEAHIRSQVEARLLEEIEKLQVALDKKSTIERPNQDSFNKLYTYVRRVQAQINQLKMAIQERNRLISELEHHLLVQEVTNKLLCANMERREVELTYFKEARRKGVVKRWHSFNGSGTARKGGQAACSRSERYPTPIQHSNKDVQKAILKLKHEEVDSLVLHFDWLEGLKQDVYKDSGDGNISKTASDVVPVQSTEAQTVMTLCNCDYLPALSPRQAHPQYSKCVQTSFPDLTQNNISYNQIRNGYSANSAPRGEVAKTKSNEVERTSSFKERKRKSTENLLDEKGRSQSCGSEITATTCVSKEEKKARRMSYTEWLLREPKPLLVEASAADNGTTVLTTAHNITSSGEVTKNAGAAVIHANPKRQTVTEACRPADEPGEPEDNFSNKPPQLPHSPIIRSKNPRKIRAADMRVQQIYADSRTWKATPPRRMIRHRRTSTDKPEQGDTKAAPTVSPEALEDDNNREVPCSDGAEIKAVVGENREVSTSGQSGSLSVSAAKPRPQGVKGMVLRFEQNSFQRGHVTRKSPSPLTVSPVRGLKSAAELMRESGERRMRSESVSSPDVSSSAQENLAAVAIIANSSDKENEASDNVQSKPVKRDLFRSKMGMKPPSLNDPPSLNTKLEKSKDCKTTPPLRDSSNNKHKSAVLEESRTSSTVTRLSMKDQGHEEDIWRKADKQKAGSTSPLQKKSSTDTQVSSSGTGLEDTSTQKAKSLNKKASSNRPSSWFSPKSPRIFKKLSGSPKHQQEPQQRTISALCMQSISVNLEETEMASEQHSSPQSPTTARTSSRGSESSATPSGASTPAGDSTPDGRKARGRFLDGNWLQKPKRFFKVSKDSLLNLSGGVSTIRRNQAYSVPDISIELSSVSSAKSYTLLNPYKNECCNNGNDVLEIEENLTHAEDEMSTVSAVKNVSDVGSYVDQTKKDPSSQSDEHRDDDTRVRDIRVHKEINPVDTYLSPCRRETIIEGPPIKTSGRLSVPEGSRSRNTVPDAQCCYFGEDCDCYNNHIVYSCTSKKTSG